MSQENKYTLNSQPSTSQYSYNHWSEKYPKQATTLWNIANYTSLILLTSAAVVAVQSPIKSILAHSYKSTFSIFNRDFLLYAGAFKLYRASFMRGPVLTYAQNNKKSVMEPWEEYCEEQKLQSRKRLVNYIISASLADVLVTQYHENYAVLQKLNLVSKEFKPFTHKNLYQIYTGALPAKSITSIINLACILYFEEQLSKFIPIENNTSRHLISGLASGTFAAVCASPFAMFRDYVLWKTTLVDSVDLCIPSTYEVSADLFEQLLSNPESALYSLLKHLRNQLPLRILMTAATFGVVSASYSFWGQQPLDKIQNRFTPVEKPKATYLNFFKKHRPGEYQKPKQSNSKSTPN